jgi:DNA mismatch repair protein MutS
MLSVCESINIEKYYFGRIALCCLLQFAYEHNVNIVKNLNKPIILNDNKYLNIEFNSALQLNLISNDKNEKPLIDILNKCCTSFGSRYFKDILLNPITNIDILNDRYDQIDFVLKNDNYSKIMKHLKGILDIERIKRKMILEKFNPQDWIGFHTSVENCILILDSFYNKSIIEYEDMIDYYRNTLDFNEVSKYNLNDIKGNIFKVGIYENIDDLVIQFQECKCVCS